MAELDREVVSQLAKVSGLNLDPARLDLIGPQFAALVAAANELSSKMSDPVFKGLAPAIRFGHPAA